jgi:Uma2 family endonuclease
LMAAAFTLWHLRGMQLVIDLPPREEQLAFNRRRWEEICADPMVASLPGKIETNAHGQILMMSPASGSHSLLQRTICQLLEAQLGGFALPECPVSTLDGVRAADVGWYSEKRFGEVRGQIAFEVAPEICVEVLSPCNTSHEMAAKKKLYFEAGAVEVWFCDEDGSMSFFCADHPGQAIRRSGCCPGFPDSVMDYS